MGGAGGRGVGLGAGLGRAVAADELDAAGDDPQLVARFVFRRLPLVVLEAAFRRAGLALGEVLVAELGLLVPGETST